MSSARRKYSELLRYFYALVAVITAAVLMVAVSSYLTRTDRRVLETQMERLHLRSSMLTAEASQRCTELELDIRRAATSSPDDADPASLLAFDRRTRAALHSVGQVIDAIALLHAEWTGPAAAFSKTVERADQQHRELTQAAVVERGRVDELAPGVASLRFTLFQLERLHSLAADELIARIKTNEMRATRRTVLTVGLVLLIAAGVVLRILLLLRYRLLEHERTEHVLLERERQLQQAGKMEALGSLVGGVAHDFNNILTALLGNTELLQERLGDASPQQRTIQEIRKAGERAAALTRQLLAFSRQQVVDLRVIDLNLLIRDLEPMLRRLIREDIRLVVRLEPGPANVEVDPAQIEQVIVNLAVNARDAMPTGGTLTLETSVVHVVDETPTRPTLTPGGYVRVLVEDTGLGIAPHVLPRVFDPFFTTKEQGKGTGLGLATVHGIVAKNKGHVFVQSEEGTGTRFEVFLPLSTKPVAEHESDASRGPAIGGTETILLAEDEAQVRELVVSALGAAGYNVLAAANGVEAQRVSAEYPGPVHLILSDVVMPGLRGPALVEQVLRHRPGCRVIYISGYAEEATVEGQLDSNIPLLTKPFKLRHLLDLVRVELNAAREDRRHPSGVSTE